MMKFLLASMIVASASCSALARDAIDQQNTVDFHSGGGALSASYWGISQTFKPSVASVSGLGIQLETGGGDGSVTLGLFTSDPYFGASALATATAYGYGGQWVDVFFSSPVTVTPGNTYYLGMRGDLNEGYCVGPASGYPSGGMHAYGTDYTSSNDTGFRTWYVPGPSGLALLAFGSAAAARRRRA